MDIHCSSHSYPTGMISAIVSFCDQFFLLVEHFLFVHGILHNEKALEETCLQYSS